MKGLVLPPADDLVGAVHQHQPGHHVLQAAFVRKEKTNSLSLFHTDQKSRLWTSHSLFCMPPLPLPHKRDGNGLSLKKKVTRISSTGAPSLSCSYFSTSHGSYFSCGVLLDLPSAH
ncbi:hypothetical protein CDAR_534311 [Caerostris darwini]|uniref:Uncharacterized protein n=1 Tax=Caerostris darwini TaxID=1538125 RepID=A0AAV4VJU1_9ARAC|nr:hypothetical protein CDAR_534311 [Caerostris darwini]